MKEIGLVFLLSLFAIVGQSQDTDDLLQAADSLSSQPEQAVEILNKALVADPNSEEVLKVRAEAYEHLKQYNKAAADYKRLTQLSPDEEINWYLLGRNLYLSGQYQDALKSLNHATKLNPRYLPAFHIKIRILLELNKNEAALKVSDSTLMIGETAMNYFLQGEVNKRLNARQKAEWAYSKATKIDKGFIEAYIALADLAAGMNKAEETLRNADAALAINPDADAAFIVRSRGFALLKQYDEAIDDVSYAIRLDPTNIQAYYWRGTYYLENHKPHEALKDFEHVLTVEPDNWQALVGRADSYAAIGDKSLALADYQQLLVDAAKYPERETITQLAHRRIFELNRENHAPQLILDDLAPDKFDIQVPENQTTITLKGKITDESPIGKFIINGQAIPVTVVDDGFVFVAILKLDGLETINIEVADIYGNVNKITYHLVRNEIGKPQVMLFTPKPSDDGTILLTSDNTTSLYIEGKIIDESTIHSIKVNGQTIDFEQNLINPVFSTIIDVHHQSSFSIVVTDRYGNTAEQTYKLEKMTDSTVETNNSKTIVEPLP